MLTSDQICELLPLRLTWRKNELLMMMRIRFQKCSNQHMVQNKWFLSKLKGLQCSCQCTSVQSSFCSPFIGELRMQKFKSHLVRTKSLNVFPLKPGVGQYMAIHATPTARDFSLTYFYPTGPFTCYFSKTSPNFFLCWLWLTPVPVYTHRIK